MRYLNNFVLTLLFVGSCLSITPDSNEVFNDGRQRMLSDKEYELFSQLLAPNDSTLQQETKQLLAQYLVAQTLADVERKQAQVSNAATAAAATEIPNAAPSSETNSPVVAAAAPESPKAAASAPQPPVTLTSTARPDIALPAVSRVPRPTTTAVPTSPPVTVSQEHVLNQVDKILGNVASGNVVGIVDESLAIRAPDPVRNLVGGILQLVFCNPLDRLFNRCRKEPVGANAAKNTASLTPNIDRLTSRLTGGNAASAAKNTASLTPNIDRLTSRLTGGSARPALGSSSGSRVPTPNIDRLTSRLTGNSNSGSKPLFG